MFWSRLLKCFLFFDWFEKPKITTIEEEELEEEEAEEEEEVEEIPEPISLLPQIKKLETLTDVEEIGKLRKLRQLERFKTNLNTIDVSQDDWVLTPEESRRLQKLDRIVKDFPNVLTDLVKEKEKNRPKLRSISAILLLAVIIFGVYVHTVPINEISDISRFLLCAAAHLAFYMLYWGNSYVAMLNTKDTAIAKRRVRFTSNNREVGINLAMQYTEGVGLLKKLANTTSVAYGTFEERVYGFTNEEILEKILHDTAYFFYFSSRLYRALSPLEQPAHLHYIETFDTNLFFTFTVSIIWELRRSGIRLARRNGLDFWWLKIAMAFAFFRFRRQIYSFFRPSVYGKQNFTDFGNTTYFGMFQTPPNYTMSHFAWEMFIRFPRDYS